MSTSSTTTLAGGGGDDASSGRCNSNTSLQLDHEGGDGCDVWSPAPPPPLLAPQPLLDTISTCALASVTGDDDDEDDVQRDLASIEWGTPPATLVNCPPSGFVIVNSSRGGGDGIDSGCGSSIVGDRRQQQEVRSDDIVILLPDGATCTFEVVYTWRNTQEHGFVLDQMGIVDKRWPTDDLYHLFTVRNNCTTTTSFRERMQYERDRKRLRHHLLFTRDTYLDISKI